MESVLVWNFSNQPVKTSLRFLGLVDPRSLSWGGMLNQAQNFLQQAWWMPFFPGAAIFLTVLSFNLAGEALNDMLDPRARTSGL